MTYKEINSQADLEIINHDQLKEALWSSIEHIKDLESQLAFFRKQIFGSKSEKVIHYDANQMVIEGLFKEVPQISEPQEYEKVNSYKRRKHNGRNKIPDNIPREHINLDPKDTICHCCHQEKKVIAEEVTEQLVRKPAAYVVKCYHRRKWACPHCKSDGVEIAPPPPSPIEKCLVDINFLIWILLSKYNDHLPLFRIQNIIKRESEVIISRSTMVGWIATLCFLLESIVNKMKIEIISSGYIHADDTKVRQQKRKQLCYFWVYQSPELKVTLFDYQLTRNKDAPKEFLKEFKSGIFLTDDYAGFNEIVTKNQLLHALCWVHARRNFVRVYEDGFQKEYCWKVILYINQLFKIERFCKKWNLTPEVRLKVRKRLSQIPLGKLENKLLHRDFYLNRKSKLLNAIEYLLGNWDKFTQFMENGRIKLDNNNVERDIRHIAVGRKNWLNTGSKEGGKRMAIMYSVLVTCKHLGINPSDYLLDIFTKISKNFPASRISELTPLQWLKSQNT